MMFFKQELEKKFKNYFNVPASKFVDKRLLQVGIVTMDIFEFENYLVSYYGYNPVGNVSMREFIMEKWGEDAVKVVLALLKNYSTKIMRIRR